MNKIVTDSRIEELYSTLSLSHALNINREAFNDISNVILSFHDKHSDEGIKQVCDASMGHGKSTVLIAYLKWLTQQNRKQPVLISVREKQLAHVIYAEVSKVSPKAIINIDAENKELYESDLYKYQIVIIQHERLKNLTLGFGNAYDYSYFVRDKAHWGKSNAKERIKRHLIIDEKPNFIDSAIFDIVSENNVLEWFDHLAEPFNSKPRTMQKHKSYIAFLLQEELADNNTDVTESLFKDDDRKGERAKDLLKILNEMKDHEENKNKYESLNKLKHFKKLLNENGYGRIDDYSFGAMGRKVIVSQFIDYSSLGMNTLIFDGTAKANAFQYAKGLFYNQHVENRNDYTRLTIQKDKINTSKYSRSKKGNPTQKAIAGRIRELKKTHKDLFVLPMKEEIGVYIKENVISDNDKSLYFDGEENKTKGINLLNTIGKNVLNDKRSLYLTCLPKRHADYYKQIAIALYGNDVSLLTSEDTDNSNWFQDQKLEQVYRGEIYSELLQIIHRTSLRNIDDKNEINIYIAFDDEPANIYSYNNYTHVPVIENISLHMKQECVIPEDFKIIDMSLYNRDKTLEGFTRQITFAFEKSRNSNELRIGKINNSFSNYIRKHWATKSSEINIFLNSYGFKIIEQKDRYSDNSKYVIKI